MVGRARLIGFALLSVTFSACASILGDFSNGSPSDASAPDGGSIPEGSTDSRSGDGGGATDAGMDVVTSPDVGVNDAPQESSGGCTGAATESCTSCGTMTRTCDGGVWSAWSACLNQVNTSTDVNNCGACQNVCAQPSAPSHGLCVSGECTEYVGGYTDVSGTTSLDATEGTMYAVQAYLGTAGTFEGLSAEIYTTAANTGELALWSDNGMETAPGELLWWVQTNLPQNNVLTLLSVSADADGGAYTDAATAAANGLAPGMYWVSIHSDFGSGGVSPVEASSTSPCVQASWINIQPPTEWSFASQQTTCPSLQQYMTVTFSP